MPFCTKACCMKVPAMMDCPTTVCCHASGLPSGPSVALSRFAHCGRYQPPCMSSSRVHTTCTGLASRFDNSTASRTKSLAGFARRPNPPPNNCV